MMRFLTILLLSSIFEYSRDDGAHRNEGPKVKAVLLDNPVNLHRKSVKIIDDDDNIKIQFTYSATLPTKMHIFFNAEDLSLPHQIR